MGFFDNLKANLYAAKMMIVDKDSRNLLIGAAGELVAKAGKAALNGTVTAAKWVGNTAMDAMCTSSENSELKYHYEGHVGDCRYGARKVLGQALVDLALKRSRDSYLRDILSRCSGIDLEGPEGQINYMLAHNRSVCKQILNGDEKTLQKILELVGNDNLSQDHVINAAKRVEAAFPEDRDYSSFVSEVFVVSVGEDIEEFVYDDNGETIRDANGNYIKKVVGTNYGVAVFKVTFSCSLKIKFKIYLNDGSWEGLRPRQYI